MVSVRLREPDPTPLGGMGSQPDGSKVNSDALFLQVFRQFSKTEPSCPKPDPKQRIVRTAFRKIMAAATTNDISIKEFTWNAQARFLGTQPL
jgi:hypothetical protein